MIHTLIHNFIHAGLITFFVISMMLIIDFLNVLTHGSWQQKIRKKPFVQYIMSSVLGATPGCLGAFAVVSMYMHKIITIGALVTVMIATSGDEAFVMFAMFPSKAFILTGFLIVAGIITGVFTDILMRKLKTTSHCCETEFKVHSHHEHNSFSLQNLFNNIKKPSFPLIVLSLLTLFFIGVQIFESYKLGLSVSNIIFLTLLTIFLIVSIFSGKHFIHEHLWKHIFIKHALNIFIWTFGALLVVSLITQYNFSHLIQKSPWLMIFIAALVGIIPESGPHLIFVMLFASGLIPFSVLLASSIVQDGHGSLPLLAHSQKDFLIVKSINVIAGLFFGLIILTLGY